MKPWLLAAQICSPLDWDPDDKVYGANMGPTWGRQDPGRPHVGPMNFAVWGTSKVEPDMFLIVFQGGNLLVLFEINHELITGTKMIIPIYRYFSCCCVNSLVAGRCDSGFKSIPDSKVHGASMGPTWDQQDPGGPHVGHMNLAVWNDSQTHYTEQ